MPELAGSSSLGFRRGPQINLHDKSRHQERVVNIKQIILQTPIAEVRYNHQDGRGCIESYHSRRSQVSCVLLRCDKFLTILSAIFNDPERLQKDFPVPVCQCVQIKALGSQGEGNPERYRIVLSDVNNFVQGMLATRKSHHCLCIDLR